MADDKKNISDDRKVDKPPEPGKVESAKAVPPVQDQPAPAGKEAPKNKDAPATSKESTLPCKDEKQTTIPGMGDPPLERWWILPPPVKEQRRTSPRQGQAILSQGCG